MNERLKYHLPFLLILVLLVVHTSLEGQNMLDKEDFLWKLKARGDSIQSIVSDFIQEREIALMEEVLRSAGKFYYKKPGLLKWDQNKPSRYYLIMREDKVIRFDGQKRKELPVNSPQVVYFKNFIMGTVDGSLFRSDQFTSHVESDDEEVKMMMVPVKGNLKKRFSRIILTFDRKTLMLKNIRIEEAGGDIMTIKFFNQQFNSLEDEHFFEE